MVKIAGRPILERIVLHLVGFGIRRIFISVNYLSEIIEQFFGDGSAYGCRIEYLRESKPLGTGGSLSLLPEKPEHPVLVLNGDLLTEFDLADMIAFHQDGNYAATVGVHEYVQTVPLGVLDITDNRITGFARNRRSPIPPMPASTCSIPAARIPKDEAYRPALVEDCLGARGGRGRLPHRRRVARYRLSPGVGPGPGPGATTMNWKGRKVLVTGAAGFIGSHLAERLVEEGAEVRALVHYNALGSAGWLDESPRRGELDIMAGDITDAESVHRAVAGREVVFHLAALIAIPYSYRAPASYVRTNISGTLHVLQAARDCAVARLVHTSTSEVYGTAKYVPIDERHPLQGQSPYSASKIGADKMVEAFCRSFGVPAVTVRPSNTFGPRQLRGRSFPP